MIAKEYILDRLNGIKKIKTNSDNGLVDFIYDRLMSKKFRKFSVNQDIKDMVRTAVEFNIKNNEPIKLVISSGAYKLWRFEEAPEADWAELFAMIYYANWLKPITDVYKPGVWFDFCSEDAILKLMNNIPTEDTEKYKQSFRVLIKFFESYLPDNLKFTFTPTGELYSSQEEFLAELNEQINKLKQEGGVDLNDKKIKAAEFNVKLEEGEEINFKENRILHDAYLKINKRRLYQKAPGKIFICSRPYGGTALPVGTTKTSIVQFQVGVGALKKKDSGFIEYILSLSQTEKLKPIYEPISIDGLPGKNFSKIRIFA